MMLLSHFPRELSTSDVVSAERDSSVSCVLSREGSECSQEKPHSGLGGLFHFIGC